MPKNSRALILHSLESVVIKARSLFFLLKHITHMLFIPHPSSLSLSSTLDRPSIEWGSYWRHHQQPWRREPEIPVERQRLLHTCVQDAHGNTPFMGMQLNRADVEWLLAKSSQSRTGDRPDLRGAYMQGIVLDHLDFSYAHLEEAVLVRADLTGSLFFGAYLQGADLSEACLKQADLREAHVAGILLYETLMDADTHLDKAVFGDMHHGWACVENTRWDGANLTVLDWTTLPMLGDERRARKRRTFLRYRSAVRANRQFATVLRDQGLNEEADSFAYRGQRLKRDILVLSVLRAVVLQRKYRWARRPLFFLHRMRRFQLLFAFGQLLAISLLAPGTLALQSRIGVYWSLVLLLSLLLGTLFVLLSPVLQVLAMLLVPMYLLVILLAFTWVLQVEFSFLQVLSSGAFLDALFFVTPFAVVVTGTFVVLSRRQGAFARTLEQLGRRGDALSGILSSYIGVLGQTLAGCGRIAFSIFLDALAGYGYKPGRSLLWYLIVIGGFAALYALVADLPFFPDALVFSLTSFHGRGFFPTLTPTLTLHHPLVMLASLEAVVGLLIEISFIATFTQRFFGR